jgi:hypothetical protein
MKTLQEIKHERMAFEERSYADALELIQSKARKILIAHNDLDEFVMGMGSWLFTRKKDGADISTVYREDIPTFALPFCRMMDEFDDLEMKVTGESMRFTATGPVVYSWGACDLLDGAGVAGKYAVGSSAQK